MNEHELSLPLFFPLKRKSSLSHLWTTNSGFCVQCKVDYSIAPASVKPAQYETKQTATAGLAACASSSAVLLILDTRHNMIPLEKNPKTLDMLSKSQCSRHLNKSASFRPPTLPGAMMRLRRGWNRWRLRGRALTSERLRYFGPAPYSGDGAEL